MFIHESIIALQNAQDERLHESLITQTEKIHRIQRDISLLNDALAVLRRRSKHGADTVDLSEAEETIRNVSQVFEELKALYPHLIDENEVLFPLDSEFSSVPIEKVEEMMDKLANLLTQRQNEIPEISQFLKLATDLNEILSKIIQEMAKEYKRAARSMIDNMIRG
jgi:uncharacterized coiled-coil DUF342 family protein